MNIKNKKMKLGVSVRWVGYFASAWREPDVPSDGGVNYEFYRDMAETAERGLFDVFFFADNLGMPTDDVPPGTLGHAYGGADLEPYTICAALSRVTRNIGLVVTASTTYTHPYHLARLTLSLDHLSNGRAGWNVVTSARDYESVNFTGESIVEKSIRYEMARESVTVVQGLWDSWEEDAFIRDKKSGVYFDPAKMHLVNHNGKYFKVRGPLNLPRSPQGSPVIIQAGSSEDGIDLASSISDIVYTAQRTIDEAKIFIGKIEGGLDRHNRRRSDVLIMPGILPVIGDSEDEAKEKYERMQQEIDPMVGIAYLATRFSGDLGPEHIDKPVVELRLEPIGIQSGGERMLKLAAQNNWTIRRMYQAMMIGHSHGVVVGTPRQVADYMEEWFRAGAADGFNILPSKSPAAVTDFVDKVVPELQRRGLFRTAYEAKTLRGNLGLSSR
jgi:FMN-dependent oxidoreductase (nitrilotriacetate monooxygenase family)